jgi:uncharacterized repeat protein (TIGR03803 family)
VRVWDFSRCLFGIGAATAILAGCGGSQPPTGAPGAMQQSAHAVVHRIATATSYRVLYSFRGGSDGNLPLANLVNVNDTLYGTTYNGGAYSRYNCGDGCGTVFSITPSGTEKVLHSFGGDADGQNPQGDLINVNGTLYGVTGGGGAYDRGTVYTISTAGAEKVLYSFGNGSDGQYPCGGLIDWHGTLYGTTQHGGMDGKGAVYSLSTSGTEKVLHSFSGVRHGGQPVAPLVSANGVLYGTTIAGDGGIAFSTTANGRFKLLHRFREHSVLEGGLLNVNRMLYGTTTFGGDSYGSVFSVTPSGMYKLLYRFQGAGGDGAFPSASLINVQGTLYGTTYIGGIYDWGTIFSITPNGTEKMLYSFTGGSNGYYPRASLINVHGMLYGTTEYGGANGAGTVFEFRS